MPSIRVKKSTHFARNIPTDMLAASAHLPSDDAFNPVSPIISSFASASQTIRRRNENMRDERSILQPDNLDSPRAENNTRERAHVTWHPASKDEAMGTLCDPNTEDSESLNFSSSDDEDDMHNSDVVEHLNVIDPRVATVTNLTNTANSILLPPIVSLKPSIAIPNIYQDENKDRSRVRRDPLDEHVEDVLGRRQQLKRSLQGVGAFLKTPLGILMAIYGFNIVFWGAGIVFFLGKIIKLDNDEKQGYWVELCCQVETGLFTLTSIGLIPWRVLDTWRMYWIWHYKHKTTLLRKKLGLPSLTDTNDLPDPVYDPAYIHVLSEDEQADLHYQQQQFMCSQTWYRPHGTETHKAFPISTAILICLLNNGNSIFQIGLCACMWGLDRFQRPAATTGTLLPAGFLCGIASALLIWRGTSQTKRTDLVEEKVRKAMSVEDSARRHTGNTMAHDAHT